MLEEFQRSTLLLGEDYLDKLKNKKIIIFGLGGVGSFVVEALARTGVINMTLVDNDTINESNINRQVIALHSTLEKYKADVMKERILDINPKANIDIHKEFYLPGKTKINLEEFDYVIDAIDTISSKIDLATNCYKKNIPIISAMACGNRINPTKFKISDIYKTYMCPICKVMRKELKKRKVRKLKVVYSTEKSISTHSDGILRRKIIGNVVFVPSVAGLIIAYEVVKDLIKK